MGEVEHKCYLRLLSRAVMYRICTAIREDRRVPIKRTLSGFKHYTTPSVIYRAIQDALVPQLCSVPVVDN